MMKKNLNDDIAQALENCAALFSLPELSRATGIHLELLRRSISRKTRGARKETWDKIYPVLKPYLLGPEPSVEPPPRIGSPYRRHHELVEMLSDQKVLLDLFDALLSGERSSMIKEFSAAAPGAQATEFSSLSSDENKLMGAYLALPEAERDALLLKWVDYATAQLKKRRTELF